MTPTDLQMSCKREDAVVLAALVALVLLAWLYLLGGAGTGMNPFAMSGWQVPMAPASPLVAGWSLSYWVLAFCMWAVMMVAMMLPGASPLVLLYGRVVRHAVANGRARHARAAVACFASGYLTTWILFSLLAVSLQWGLERAGATSTMMSLGATPLSGAVLVATGLYQLTPLKAACLKHCRGPAAILAAHWRPGLSGAWRMGLVHGTYCLGCCAVLMLLLFVGGVMNLVWIAALTLFVAVEKLAPFGKTAATAMGTVLIAWGGALILAGL